MTVGLWAVGVSDRLELAFLALKKSATDAIRDNSGKKINYYMDGHKRATVWKRIRKAPGDIEYALMFHRREAELFGLIEEAAGNGDKDAAAEYMRRFCGNIRKYTEYVELHRMSPEPFLEHLSYMDWRNLGMISFNIFGTKEGVLEEIAAMEPAIGTFQCEATEASGKYSELYRDEIYCLERQLENHGFAI